MHLVRIGFSDVREECMVLTVKGGALRHCFVDICEHIKWIAVSPHLGHVVHNDVEVLFVDQVINCKRAYPILDREI